MAVWGFAQGYFIISMYWVKIVHAHDKKYVRKVQNMLKYDFESNPDKKNWCSLLYGLIVYCFCHLLNSD